MRYLIDDLNSFLEKKYYDFLTEKLITNSFSTSYFILILGVLNVSLCFSYCLDGGKSSFFSFFAFFTFLALIFKFFYIPYLVYFMKKFFYQNVNLNRLNAVYNYSFFPFLFLFPTIFIFKYMSASGYLFFFTLIMHLIYFIKGFSLTCARSFFESMFIFFIAGLGAFFVCFVLIASFFAAIATL
jgi:hypothetical protein